MIHGDLNAMTPTAMPPHRRRWWLDIRRIMAGVVVGTIAFLLWGLFGPEPAVRVSRETTFLTEPLAADGLPDYRAALLAMAGPAPPPEDNAAAALLQISWPLGIDAADLPAVCVALGIPEAPPSDPLRDPYEDAASKVTVEDYVAGFERPWTGEELPALEAWQDIQATADGVVLELLNSDMPWEASDIVVRMPMPSRLVFKPSTP